MNSARNASIEGPHPLSQAEVAGYLTPRLPDSHKGMFGRVVVGGDAGMVGAALLAGRAALKMGAGAVHVCLMAPQAPEVDMVQPELMLHPAGTWQSCLGQGQDRAVLAAGCGLGVSVAARKLLHEILACRCPLVLDADALNLLARHEDLKEDLRDRSSATLITPHPGEAARLLGMSVAEVQKDRTGVAQGLARTLNCEVALKGHETLCASPSGTLRVNRSGNPGMSAPGMGDVLTGMVAAFIAQGMESGRALQLAVHLHGAAGDALAREGVAAGMTASDVIEWARWLHNQWMPRT